MVVSTLGREGGSYVSAGEEETFSAVELPGPLVDAYGAGDCFAAGLAFALAGGDDVKAALAFAARCGATALRRRGAHGAR
jgi:ribokinase